MELANRKLFLPKMQNVASAPELMIGGEIVEHRDHFTLISPEGQVPDEISGPVQKARLASDNSRHLWRRQDIHLPTKNEFAAHQFAPS